MLTVNKCKWTFFRWSFKWAAVKTKSRETMLFGHLNSFNKLYFWHSYCLNEPFLLVLQMICNTIILLFLNHLGFNYFFSCFSFGYITFFFDCFSVFVLPVCREIFIRHGLSLLRKHRTVCYNQPFMFQDLNTYKLGSLLLERLFSWTIVLFLDFS